MSIMQRLWRISSSSLEIQNSLSAMLAGVILLLPYTTFTQAAAYNFFDSIAPEYIWGILFLVLGLFQVVSVTIDLVIMRRISAALLAVLFLIYIVGIIMNNPISLAAPFVAPMVIGQTWAFFQVRNVR